MLLKHPFTQLSWSFIRFLVDRHLSGEIYANYGVGIELAWSFNRVQILRSGGGCLDESGDFFSGLG